MADDETNTATKADNSETLDKQEEAKQEEAKQEEAKQEETKQEETKPTDQNEPNTEPVDLPTKPPADGLSRMTSVSKLFSTGDSIGALMASSDLDAALFKSNVSFQSIGSIGGGLPPLQSVADSTASASTADAQGKSAAGPSSDWGNQKYVTDLMASQDPAIQKMIQSISRAAPTLKTVKTEKPDELKSESSSNQKMTAANQSNASGLFTSREWGSDLGPIQDDDDIKDVFQSTAQGKAEKFQAANRVEKPLAEPNPSAAEAAQTKNRLPKKKRDWNAQVMQDLEACLPTKPNPPRPVNCATPADAAILAAAAANFGKCGSNPAVITTVKEGKKSRPPKKRGVSPDPSGDKPVVEPQPPMEPDDKSGKNQDDVGIFVEPADEDVLLGRGGRTNNHPGNKKYLEAKDAMQERYMAADKNAKTPISQELVDIVKSWGGRFLKMNGAGKWYTIDDSTARKKCSQSLREVNTAEERAAKRARYVNK